MSIQAEFADYLTRMLARPVGLEEPVTLSSGQQARAAGWLRERGCNPPDLRAKLRSRFSAAQFAVTGVAAAASATLGPAAAHSGGPHTEAPVDGSGATQPRLRVGIDIQRTDEIVPAGLGPDLKSSVELRAIFTLREISYAQSRPSPDETLCGLFCAKEALRKCDDALIGLPLTAIEVLPGPDGKPAYAGYALSISHSAGLGIAVALADLAVASRPPASLQPPARGLAAEPPGASRAGSATTLVRLLVVASVLTVFVIALERLGVLRGIN